MSKLLKDIWPFGLAAAAILALVYLGQMGLITGVGHRLWWVALIAVGFLVIGLLIRNLISPRKEIGHPVFEPANREAYGISDREYEVLLAMSKGLSNSEIGRELFISESTVKTHVSNLLVKLDARRRTEAITKAREQGLVP